MMIKDIAEGISRAVNEEFGDEYKIYNESVEQGLEEPCFFIQCLSSSLKEQFGGQYFMENFFCIQYFPKDALHPVSESLGVSERLFTCLEYISVDGEPVRGINKNYEIHDEILSFFLNYNLFVRMGDNKKSQKMERLEKIILEADL